MDHGLYATGYPLDELNRKRLRQFGSWAWACLTFYFTFQAMWVITRNGDNDITAAGSPLPLQCNAFLVLATKFSFIQASMGIAMLAKAWSHWYPCTNGWQYERADFHTDCEHDPCWQGCNGVGMRELGMDATHCWFLLLTRNDRLHGTKILNHDQWHPRLHNFPQRNINRYLISISEINGICSACALTHSGLQKLDLGQWPFETLMFLSEGFILEHVNAINSNLVQYLR